MKKTKENILEEIKYTQYEMYRMNVNSPQYHTLQCHIKELEKELENEI